MKKRTKQQRDPLLNDFSLVPETPGKIVNGVYIKNDSSELIIKFAWGGALHFKPMPTPNQ